MWTRVITYDIVDSPVTAAALSDCGVDEMA